MTTTSMNDINDGFIYVTEHVAHIRKIDGSLVPVLPMNLSWQMQQPMLTLSIDQGGVGMAAAAFLLKDHMLHTRCDKIHRVVRDYQLAIGHAADGLFLKAQLHSGYVFSINYRPFNKGNFFERKKDMVESFLATRQLGKLGATCHGDLLVTVIYLIFVLFAVKNQ